MKFDVQQWHNFEAGLDNGVILAQCGPSHGVRKSFRELVKELPGSDVWLPSIEPFIDNFCRTLRSRK